MNRIDSSSLYYSIQMTIHDFKFADTLLTREEIIQEIITRCNNLEMTKDDNATSIAQEIINDPCDTLNHFIPNNILSDNNKLSDYYHLIADEASQRL